jgi:6-phosphogluconolactonase
LPIDAAGKVGKATGFNQHKGSSVDKSRQEGPHAHSVNLDAANKFAFVADLGLDKVLVFRFDAEKGTIEPNDPPAADVAPGAGPRHFAFHPSGKFAYVINELDMTVTAFTYDAGKGKLTTLQTMSTIPGSVEKGYSTAEVVVHPTGKFLYGSNRGHNTIAAFTIAKDGKLTRVGNQGHNIKTPRNFNLDPTGKYLLVGSQDGDRIVVFRVDMKTGELEPTGEEAEVPMPVCLRFVAKK